MIVCALRRNGSCCNLAVRVHVAVSSHVDQPEYQHLKLERPISIILIIFGFQFRIVLLDSNHSACSGRPYLQYVPPTAFSPHSLVLMHRWSSASSLVTPLRFLISSRTAMRGRRFDRGFPLLQSGLASTKLTIGFYDQFLIPSISLAGHSPHKSSYSLFLPCSASYTPLSRFTLLVFHLFCVSYVLPLCMTCSALYLNHFPCLLASCPRSSTTIPTLSPPPCLLASSYTSSAIPSCVHTHLHSQAFLVVNHRPACF